MTLSVVATITAKPEFHSEVREALHAMLAPSRAEAGCHQYALHVDQAAPDRFVMIENWEDGSALDAHMASPHFAALVKALDGRVTGVDIVRLDPLG